MGRQKRMGGFVDIGVLGYPADTSRTQDPVIITGNDELQDAPLRHAVPQGELAATGPNNLSTTSEVSALGYAVGTAELAAKGVWNGLVEVGAGLSGLGTVLLTGDGAAGTAVVEGIKEQYGAALKTEGAEAIGEAVAPVFEKYEAGKEHLGELGMSQDSPGLATALYTAPDALMSVAGGFLGRGAISSTKNAGARGLDGPVVPNKIDDILRKIPEADYLAIKGRSVHNVDSDTLVLGKYMPTIKNGVKDWSAPGPDSYNVIARTEKATYFDLGSEWGSVTSKYNLSDAEMFRAFNIPVLDDAVGAGKQIKFTHDPRTSGGFLQQEWEYLQNTFGYKRLKEIDGVWYAK